MLFAHCKFFLNIVAVFLLSLCGYFTLFVVESDSSNQVTMKASVSEPKNIIIIGGGVVGCSAAYFLTRHAYYNPKIHSIVILEASKIAGGSSGKAGGLFAEWATPKCLAPLSFKTHVELAKEHDGGKIWGHRRVYCAEVELQAQEGDEKFSLATEAESQAQPAKVPSELDWLLPGSVKSYKESGNPKNSGQVNPYMFTKTLAKLAEEKGVKIVMGSVTAINYKDNN